MDKQLWIRWGVAIIISSYSTKCYTEKKTDKWCSRQQKTCPIIAIIDAATTRQDTRVTFPFDTQIFY